MSVTLDEGLRIPVAYARGAKRGAYGALKAPNRDDIARKNRELPQVVSAMCI
jgi:hypothetical protein